MVRSNIYLLKEKTLNLVSLNFRKEEKLKVPLKKMDKNIMVSELELNVQIQDKEMKETIIEEMIEEMIEETITEEMIEEIIEEMIEDQDLDLEIEKGIEMKKVIKGMIDNLVLEKEQLDVTIANKMVILLKIVHNQDKNSKETQENL